jgi:dihydrofolate synthase / folylpolyglutamate synthase
MIVNPIKTRIFEEGENLFEFVTNYIEKLSEQSVVVITSKIVALAENRTAEVSDDKAKEQLVRSESEFAVPTKYVWLTIKDGMVMATAGIDESNAKGKWILLPKDSFQTAEELRTRLQRHHNVNNLGVLITDSRTAPFRAGVTGVAVGYAGFRGIKDYRGTPDIFGRKFKFAQTNVADSLATAAAYVMGEGAEQQPLAIIENANVEFVDQVDSKELLIDIQDDMYKPLFSGLPNHK